MDIQRLLTGLSLKIIIQFSVVVAAGIALVTLNFEVIYPFYFENQLTNTGIVINSAIMGLLIIGLGNIFYHLLRYRREEIAISGFVNNVESIKADLLEGLQSLFEIRPGVINVSLIGGDNAQVIERPPFP